MHIFRPYLPFIIEGIQDIKGVHTVCLDVSHIPDAVCKQFVICEGTSTTHVRGIAGSIEEKIKKQFGENPFSVEGTRGSEWVILDYIEVVVHIFLKEKRDFYQLEELWSDAVTTNYDTPPPAAAIHIRGTKSQK
ncbi:MAG: ribosome silencing factor [Sphingobacteriales bacterium]|nr:ribosome silencing factor [Sphingobacteriales bacterium]